MTNCKNCKKEFISSQEDLKFYSKLHVSPPTFCPSCRQQRRLAWRNERTLYSRGCDLCHKHLISIYPDKVPFPVYCNDCWWSDKCDPLQYAQKFDSDKSFFEQFKELQNKVPRLSIYLKKAENSDYCNHSENLKNSYMSVDTADSENIYYSKWIINKCKDLVDCYNMEKAELCYESLYSVGSYNCVYAFLCDNSRDSAFIYDCVGCSNCFMCHNLRHKQYCIENKEYSKEEYEKIISEIDLGSYETFQKYYQKYLEFFYHKAVKKFQNILFSQDCSGDFIYHCKNVKDSYDVIESEDCSYCYESGYLKDCHDTYEAGFACELQYDSHACNRGSRVIAGHVSYDVDSVMYVDSCHNSSDLFGCVGLKRKQYCILNHQYSKEEYNKIVPTIIKNMHDRGEWGEFFPIELSIFAYNESLAQEFFPLTKEQAQAKGYRWKDKDKIEYKKATIELPDNINEISEKIVSETLACKNCEKNYRLTTEELRFYKKMNITVPRFCSFCRHITRMSLRNPHQLHTALCQKCNAEILTPYNPEKSEIVYCEECYLETAHS